VAPPCEAAGWLLTEKMAEMKHGEPMEFLTFEDQTAMYDAMLFPDAYRAIAIR
jgi:error-prone DNA polymerase